MLMLKRVKAKNADGMIFLDDSYLTGSMLIFTMSRVMSDRHQFHPSLSLNFFPLFSFLFFSLNIFLGHLFASISPVNGAYLSFSVYSSSGTFGSPTYQESIILLQILMIYFWVQAFALKGICFESYDQLLSCCMHRCKACMLLGFWSGVQRIRFLFLPFFEFRLWFSRC